MTHATPLATALPVSATATAPVCHFFNSKVGCENGDSCAFRHEKWLQDGSNVLFVGKLRRAEDTEQALWDYFKCFGRLFSVKVKADINGASRGFAFVTYVDAKSADRALAGKHDQWDIKRKAAMDDVREVHLNPLEIRFTHHGISFCFTNGKRLDDVIASIESKRMSFDEFPAMQVVKREGTYFSLSNRRLFVARVLANRKCLSRVAVKVLDPTSNRVCWMKDGRTKWQRSYSTRNGGKWVQKGGKRPCPRCHKLHGSRFWGQEWLGPRPEDTRLPHRRSVSSIFSDDYGFDSNSDLDFDDAFDSDECYSDGTDSHSGCGDGYDSDRYGYCGDDYD